MPRTLQKKSNNKKTKKMDQKWMLISKCRDDKMNVP